MTYSHSPGYDRLFNDRKMSAIIASASSDLSSSRTSSQTPVLLPLLLFSLLLSPGCSAMAFSGAARSSAGASIGDDVGPNGAQNRRAVLDDGSVLLGYKRIVSSRSVWHYMGVPFAKPPVGRLRFQRAEPLDAPVGSAERPFRAFTKPKTCYYHPMFPREFETANKAFVMWWNNTEMSEDCLYLNVWTPAETAGRPLAVMIWIYGGSFSTGSASLDVYDGAVLAAKGDVVVVSMQYRTGPLGFMFLHDTEAPGNMGLTDQLMAMKWVKANIRHFGGDPDRVTLFGESAGAVSVNFHMLSPYSQTYFQRAIMQSATATAWWASENRARGEQRAKQLAEFVGCYYDENNKARVVECMRHINIRSLQEAADKSVLDSMQRMSIYARYRNSTRRGADAKPGTTDTYMYFDLLFRPVFGTDFLPHDYFTAMDRDMYKKADVLLGVMKDEGVFWIMYALSSLFLQNHSWSLPAHWGQPMLPEDSRTQRFEEDPYDLVARYFIHSNNINNRLVDTVAFEYQVPSRRFGFERWTSRDVLDAFDDLTSDRSFKCPVMDFADYYIDKLAGKRDRLHRVWVYTFDHRTEQLPLPEWTGAMHGYELDYIFGMPFDDSFQKNYYPYNDLERTLSQDVIQFWSNFAKTGNPNQADVATPLVKDAFMTWPQYTRYNRSHIVLDTKTGVNYAKASNLRRRQCQFWRRIEAIRREMIANGQWCPTVVEKAATVRAQPDQCSAAVTAGCVQLLILLLSTVQ